MMVSEHTQTLLQKPVGELANLLLERSDLREALVHSIRKAARPDLNNIEDFFTFLNKILTHIPTEKELMPSVREFYYVLSHSPGNILRQDKQFNDWILRFVNSRGDFLDTPESVGCLETFIINPEYKAGDYIKGPSGWLSFNQFLARQLKPGKRPVEAPEDNTIVVSPVDGMWKGQWQIESDSSVTVKGKKYSIEELITGSAYQDKFEDGIFTHTFLSITDYHRYHLPIGGVIREVRQIPGGTWVNETVKEDGSLENTDNIGFQFAHTRACIIIESIVGFVAVIPVGMGHISSTVITAETGINLRKGDEFGFFGFGGSDIIMLFQADRVELTARPEVQYRQGEQVGHAI
jgi:phosphatidylserine decarboxylase